jgi:hypothetical protein
MIGLRASLNKAGIEVVFDTECCPGLEEGTA